MQTGYPAEAPAEQLINLEISDRANFTFATYLYNLDATALRALTAVEHGGPNFSHAVSGLDFPLLR